MPLVYAHQQGDLIGKPMSLEPNIHGIAVLRAIGPDFTYSEVVEVDGFRYFEEYCGLGYSVFFIIPEGWLLGDTFFRSVIELTPQNARADFAMNWADYAKSTEYWQNHQLHWRPAIAADFIPTAISSGLIYSEENILNELNSYKQDSAESKQTIEDLKIQVAESAQSAASLKTQLELSQQSNLDLAAQLEESIKNADLLKKQLELSQKSNTALVSQLKESRKNTAALETQLVTQQKESRKNTAALETQLEVSKKSNTSMNAELESTNKKLQESIESKNDMRSTAISDKQIIKELKKQLHITKASLDASNAQLTIAKKSEVGLSQQLAKTMPLTTTVEWKNLLEASKAERNCNREEQTYRFVKQYAKCFDAFLEYVKKHGRDINENESAILLLAIKHNLAKLCKQLVVSLQAKISEQLLREIFINITSAPDLQFLCQQYTLQTSHSYLEVIFGEKTRAMIGLNQIGIQQRINILRLGINNAKNPVLFLSVPTSKDDPTTLFVAFLLGHCKSQELQEKIAFIDELFSKNLVNTKSLFLDPAPNVMFFMFKCHHCPELLTCLLKNLDTPSFGAAIIQKLLAQNPFLYANDPENCTTPLHLALHESRQHVEILLQYGADPFATDHENLNVLEYFEEIDKSHLPKSDINRIEKSLSEAMQQRDTWARYLRTKVKNLIS